MSRPVFSLVVAVVMSGCSGWTESDRAGFDPDAAAGVYEFETRSEEGLEVRGHLLVEGEPGAYVARAESPGLAPLEFGTVRAEGHRLVLEGPTEGLRVELEFRGAEFRGHWEVSGERSEVTGRIAAAPAAAGHAGAGALRFGSFEELHQVLAQRFRDGQFSGAVLVAEGGEVLFERAYGLRYRGDMRPGTVRPIEGDTRFDLASLGKLFTAVAVLRLAQDGHLELDATAAEYLGRDAPSWAHAVTVRHLLQHRAGLGDFLTHVEFREARDRFRSVDDYMRLVRGEQLGFEPGTDWGYSNSGYVVLGAIVEATTGESFHEVVRRLVYEPAGMTATGPTRDQRSATGYTADRRGNLVPTDDRRAPFASPAGGSYGTAADLHRFLHALMSDQLLAPEYTDTLLRNFDGPGGDPIDRRGQWDVGWSGEVAGVSTAAGYNAGTGRYVVVLSNLDGPAAIAVAEALLPSRVSD